MAKPHSPVELRLLLEEICSDLFRYEHTVAKGIAPGKIRIVREANLGRPGNFADIRVQPDGEPAFFVEVDFGYTNDALVKALARKYGTPTPETLSANRVVLVVNGNQRANWDTTLREARTALHPGLELDVWDEDRLQERLKSHFSVEIDRIEPDRLLDVRTAIDHSNGRHAFRANGGEAYEHDALRSQLLWHLGFWRVQELFDTVAHPRAVLEPGTYREAAILMVDMCSFSSYVRDTPSADIVREALTAFYSKARSQIIDNGGLHYQFVGDEVVGIFGVPDRRDGYLDAAYETARAICAIGKSVASQWQRRIDRQQPSCGVHAGMALGDLELLPLRPYCRTHIGFVGDSLNVAARLMGQAASDEIVVANSLYQRLDEKWQSDFTQTDPVEAKNVGRIVGWRSKVAL